MATSLHSIPNYIHFHTDYSLLFLILILNFVINLKYEYFLINYIYVIIYDKIYLWLINIFCHKFKICFSIKIFVCYRRGSETSCKLNENKPKIVFYFSIYCLKKENSRNDSYCFVFQISFFEVYK